MLREFNREFTMIKQRKNAKLKIKQQKRMNRAQKHLIKVLITLKKVEITVRFPCSLAFTLKSCTFFAEIEKNHVECSKMYQLKNGQSLIDQTVQLHTQLTLIGGKYQDKKITLTIYMVSANGKIPAGSATISPTAKILGDTKLNLDKCPDRNASVYLTQKFEVLSIETLEEINQGEEILFSGRQNMRNLNNSVQKGLQGSLNSSVADILRRSRESRQNSSLSKDQNRQLKLSSVSRVPGIQTARGQFTKSKVDRGSSEKPDHNQRMIYTREREDVPILVFDSQVSRVQSNYTMSNQYGNESQQMQDQQVKIMRLEREKAECMRELARLKGELEQVNEFRVTYLEGELQRVREESDNKAEEVTKYADAIKDKQRTERELIYEIKLMQEELDKKSAKLILVENQRRKLEAELANKGKELQQAKNDWKKSKQQIQELKLTLTNTQKKYELQSGSYKEQIKKLNEKCALSEAERQKATIELSNLLTDLQNSEKKGQLAFKEREKNFIDEKAKLTKKIDFLTEQNQKLEESNEEHKQKIVQIEQQLSLAKKKLSEEESNGSKLSFQLKDLMEKFNNFQKELRQNQNRLEQVQQFLNQEKSSYKTQIAQLTQELSVTKAELSKTLSVTESIRLQNNELQQGLNMRKSECTSIDTRYHSLKKDYDSIKKQQAERDRLAETLSVENCSKQQKINNLLDKLKQQQFKYEQMTQQFQHQILYLQQSKTYLEQDLNDYKQAFQSESHKNCMLQEQSKKLNQQVFELNRQLLEFVEKQVSHEAKVKDLEYASKAYLDQMASFETRNKQLKSELNQKNEEIYNLQKANKNLEHEKFVLEQNVGNLEQVMKEKSQTVRENLTERQKRLNEKTDELTDLKRSQQEMKSMILNLKSEVNQCKNLLKMRTEEKQQLLIDYEKMSQELEMMRSEVRDAKQEMLEWRLEKEKLERELSEKLREMSKIRQEREQFRQSTIEGMSQLLEMLWPEIDLSSNESIKNIEALSLAGSSGQNSRLRPSSHLRKQEQTANQSNRLQNSGVSRNSSGLKQFPDEEMANIQFELISKRNQWMQKINSHLLSLEDQIKQLQNVLSKDKNHSSEREQQYEEQLMIQREKWQMIEEEKNAQISHLQAENQQLSLLIQQKHAQTQKLTQLITKLQQQGHELNEYIKTSQEDRSNMREQIEQLQQLLQELKVKQIKANGQREDLLLSAKEHFESSLALVKQAKDNREHKYLQVQMDLAQRQNHILSLQRQMQALQDANKHSAKIKEEQENTARKYEFNCQQTVALLEQSKFKINDLEQQIEDLTGQLSNCKAQNNELSAQVKRNQEQIQEQSLKIEKLQFQLRSLSQAQSQANQELKSHELKATSKQTHLQQQLQSAGIKNMQLNSKLELLSLQHERATGSIAELQATNRKLAQQLKQKLKEIKLKEDELHTLQLSNSMAQNQLQMATTQLQAKNQQLLFIKQQLQAAQQSITRHQLSSADCSQLQTQINQLQQELFAKESHFQQTLAKLQQALVEAKKQLAFQSSKQDEQRRQIRQLQQIVHLKQNQISQTANQLLRQVQRDQLELSTQIHLLNQQLQTKNSQLNNISQQHLFQKEHLKADILQKTQQIQDLSSALIKHQKIINQLHKQLQHKQSLIEQLEVNLKESLSEWQKEKSALYPCDQKLNTIKTQISKFQQFSKSIDAHSRQLIEIAKKNAMKPQHDQNHKGITQILREVSLLCMKTKTKLLSRCSSDKDKELIISDYRVLHDKLESAMKSHGVVKPIGFN